MQLKRNNTPYDLATVKIKLSKKLDKNLQEVAMEAGLGKNAIATNLCTG